MGEQQQWQADQLAPQIQRGERCGSGRTLLHPLQLQGQHPGETAPPAAPEGAIRQQGQQRRAGEHQQQAASRNAAAFAQGPGPLQAKAQG